MNDEDLVQGALEMPQATRSRWRRGYSVAILVLLTVLLVCAYRVYTREKQAADREATYQAGRAAVAQGDYDAGFTILEPLQYQNYKDAQTLYEICVSLRAYKYGSYSVAYWHILDVHPTGLTQEEQARLDAYRAFLEAQYSAEISAELDAIDDARAQARKDGVPYIGMRERDIHSTSLGRASKIVVGAAVTVDGQSYTSYYYFFMQDGRQVYRARCAAGRVISVRDLGSGAAQRQQDDDDPYHASDYYGEDDFYEDHYDDFYDYEDAADYWYDHS